MITPYGVLKHLSWVSIPISEDGHTDFGIFVCLGTQKTRLACTQFTAVSSIEKQL